MTPLQANGFDLFWRNPQAYSDQLKEMGEVNVAWDRGILSKLKIDQQTFSKNKFSGVKKFWRSYNISSWDCIEFDSECETGKPRAVYPTFDWINDDLDLLLGYIVEPWGEDESLLRDPGLTPFEKPVRGQPHRIFITNTPPARTFDGRYAMSLISKLQRENPQCELFVHRLYGYGDLFGRDFRAGDMDPRMVASKGQVYLTSGKKVDSRTFDRDTLANFTRPLGWMPEELDDAKNRCKFNILTARWASLHWDKEGRPPMNVPKDFRPDAVSSDVELNPLSIKKNLPVSS